MRGGGRPSFSSFPSVPRSDSEPMVNTIEVGLAARAGILRVGHVLFCVIGLVSLARGIRPAYASGATVAAPLLFHAPAHNPMPRSVLSATALAVACTIAVCAQSGPAPLVLPAVEITGTRLARPLAESPVAATVLTRDDLDRSGRTSLAEIIRELPAFPGNQITDTVAINSTRGVIAADLRGFGAGNTLVLVNGRRTTVSASAWDTTTFVDLNRFPPGLLERVEILKGGASAVYGADAVGGVLNLITRRAPAGGEARLSYGNSFDTDTAELAASVVTGATRGPLGISVGVDYLQRHALAHRDRFFSRTANLAPRFAATYDFYGKLPAVKIETFFSQPGMKKNVEEKVA